MSFIQDIEERIKILKVNRQKLEKRITKRKSIRKAKIQQYKKKESKDEVFEEEKEAKPSINLKTINEYNQSALLPRRKGTRNIFNEQ